MAFVIAFGLSLMFAFGSERCHGKGFFFYFFSICSVLSVSVLNGIRDYSIGTDIKVYGKQIFEDAVYARSFADFIEQCNRIGMTEYGYAIFNYLISIFTNNLHVFLFIVGIIVNGAFFYCCLRLRNVANLNFMWSAYLFLFYATTLNLLRQSIALALIFIAVVKIFDKRFGAAFVIVSISYFFHHSAVMGFLPLLFTFVVNKVKSEQKKNACIVVFLILSAFLPIMISKLSSMGLLDEKYGQYLGKGDGVGSIANGFLIRLPFVIMALFYLIYDRYKKSDERKILWTFVIAESILLPLQLISPTLFRVALYFGIFKIPGYASLIERCRFSKSLLYVLYASYLVFYFVYMIVIQGSNQVYPFVIASDL